MAECTVTRRVQGEKQAVIKFVDEFYAAGVVMVYVTGIETLGGTEVTETLLFGVCRRILQCVPEYLRSPIVPSRRFRITQTKDVGQKYLSFVLD